MSDSCDFVLAFSPATDSDSVRRHFEQKLERAGLKLDRVETKDVCFVKVRVSDKVLKKYAEILKLQVPIKLEHVETRSDQSTLKEPYSSTKSFLFDEKHPEYFQEKDRIFVAAYILDNEPYQKDESKKGIKNLIADGVYISAFPLHDEESSQNLLKKWATMGKSMHSQPITNVKNYFGTNIALYFAWLGFYTRMLIFPASISIIYILYGLITLADDKLSMDICSTNITMCPLCDKHCRFWNLRDTCVYARLSYLIDNPLTPYYCCLVSIWSAVYFQLWKRYNARLIHRWGSHSFDVDDEPDRPQQSFSIFSRMRDFGMTKKRIKYSAVAFSYSVVIFWVLLVFSVTFGILIYKICLSTSARMHAGTKFNKYFVDVTCGILDVICIYFLENLYNRLMVWLTEIEMHRSQREFDDSLALKLFLFQFANRFSSILYIAFLKGRLVGYPKEYNRILGFRQEECQPGGCLTELSIQLLILIFGMHTLPYIMAYIKSFVIKVYEVFYVGKKAGDEIDLAGQQEQAQILKNYKLISTKSDLLFYDYLQMVMQFAYLTIFISAFPIAPLIAVFNNIFELRYDALKMLIDYQKPVPQRARTIGIWAYMIEATYQIGIYSNSFILAFSTNFIPKTVHAYQMSSMSYLNYSLAVFATEDFEKQAAPLNIPTNLTVCRYKEFRNPPNHEFPYKRPIDYWYILSARLAFMLIFQILVALIQKCVRWLLPDTPRSVKRVIRREMKAVTEALILEERKHIEMIRESLSSEAHDSDENIKEGVEDSRCNSETEVFIINEENDGRKHVQDK